MLISRPLIFLAFFLKNARVNQSRKKFSSILTLTPNRNKIAQKKDEKEMKKSKKTSRAAKRNIFECTQDSDSEDMDIEAACFRALSEDEAEDDIDKIIVVELGEVSNVKIDDFVICAFSKKTTVQYYIAQVIEDIDDELDIQVKFLRKSKQENHFFFSGEEASVPITDVKTVLPKPVSCGTTTRTKSMMRFNVNFGDICIC